MRLKRHPRGMKKLLLVLLLSVGCQRMKASNRTYDTSFVPEPEVMYYIGNLVDGSATVWPAYLEGHIVYVFLDDSHTPIPFHAQGAPYPSGPVYGIQGISIYIVQAQGYSTYRIVISK